MYFAFLFSPLQFLREVFLEICVLLNSFIKCSVQLQLHLFKLDSQAGFCVVLLGYSACMSLGEQLYRCDTEPSESLKVDFFSLARNHFRIILTIDRSLVQIQTLLCLSPSRVSSKNKINPRPQFCLLKCLAHLKLKLPNSHCPRRQLNIIDPHAQMVRA